MIISHPLESPTVTDDEPVELNKVFYGEHLLASDHDRLKIFMHEFFVRGMISWVERTMRNLIEQLKSRRSLSWFSTRKLFASSKSVPNLQAHTSVVYTDESAEMQQRRLGDLAFMFQLYDLAYDTFHNVKKEFNHDNAFVHEASSKEMAAFAVFMQGMASGRSYPHKYVEEAMDTYLKFNKNIHLATRALFISLSVLRMKNQHEASAVQAIRLTGEDSDLRSALLLEQAAICYLRTEPPMAFKFAFHMILAGHRYNKANQKQHALRCYSQALQVYRGHGWYQASDHIYYTIGKMQASLAEYDGAASSFMHLLTHEMNQTAAIQQATFIKEYIQVFHKSKQGPDLPILPLPVLNGEQTIIRILGPVSSDDDVAGVLEIEKKLAASCYSDGLPYLFRPFADQFSSSTDNTIKPQAAVGQHIFVSVTLENPLDISIYLRNVGLVMQFTDLKGNVSTNEDVDDHFDKFVSFEQIGEVSLPTRRVDKIDIKVFLKERGELVIRNLVYTLSPVSLESVSSEAEREMIPELRGVQNIVIQGKKLYKEKEHFMNSHFATDHRLCVNVGEPMPYLKAEIKTKTDLLIGELSQVKVSLTNTGPVPPVNARFAVKGVSVVEANTVLKPMHPRRTLSIEKSIFDDVIINTVQWDSTNTTTKEVFFTIQAPSCAGDVSFTIIFYYESKCDFPATKLRPHRILKASCNLTIAEPFQLSIQALPSQSADAVILPLQLTNNVQGNKLRLSHITHAGDEWTLSSFVPNSDVWLENGQTLSYNFKASLTHGDEDVYGDNGILVLPTSIQNEQIAKQLKLLCDNWNYHNDVTDNSDVLASRPLRIAAVWNTIDSEDRERFGVICLTLTTFKFLQKIPAAPPSRAEPIQPAILSLSKKTKPQKLGLNSNSLKFSLLCSLKHVTKVEHDFSAHGFCRIPVVVCLRNVSDRSVTIKLHAPIVSCREQGTIFQYEWSGKCHDVIELEASQEREHSLDALFWKPGVYYLNTVKVVISVASNDSQDESIPLAKSCVIVSGKTRTSV